MGSGIRSTSPTMKTVPLLLLLVAAGFSRASEPVTEIRYLSGHGPKDAMPWEFSVTGGRRAGEWTTIPVPSQWELQGFGTYNYGQEKTSPTSTVFTAGTFPSRPTGRAGASGWFSRA
jgi:hypothetical protein